MKITIFFRLLVLCVMLSVSNQWLFAQKLIAKDKTSETPIEGITLISYSPQVIIVTNNEGQVDISPFKNSVKIEVRGMGFETISTTYTELVARNGEIRLQPVNFNLDEVVVAATRWQQPYNEVPGKISKISAKEILLQNPQTAADLLGNSGEVFIQKSQQGGGSPMIRGFATNRLLYALDGVRMNTAIFRAGNLQNVISLDPLAIENAEVMFGPASVIYGSDAIGGVMSFQTLSPQLSADGSVFTKGKVVTRYASVNNEQTAHFDVSAGWKKWAFLTSVTSNNFGDLKMGQYGPSDYLRTFYVERIGGEDKVITNPNPLVQRPTGYSQLNLMSKIRFRPNQNWDINYAFHYSDIGGYSRYDRLIETASGLPRSAVWNYGPQLWSMNQLTAQHSKKNLLYDSFILRLAKQYFEESRIDRNFSGGSKNRLRTQKEGVDAVSLNVDFDKRIGHQTLFYGFEVVQNEVTSTGSAINIVTNEPIAVADRYPQSVWRNTALYLNYQWKATPKLLLQAGGRYTKNFLSADFSKNKPFFPFEFSVTEINNGAPTGSLGAVYSPTSDWRISINASTGFRVPNVDDMGKLFDFAAGTVIVPNPNLKAEMAYNGEINIAKVFGNIAKLDVTAFYTTLSNAMVRRAFNVNGRDSILYNGTLSKVYAIQNAAKANVYGFQASIELKPVKHFMIASQYNYQRGEEEMDSGNSSRSRHAAPPFGVTRLVFSDKKLQLQLYAVYCSEVSYENLNEEERQKPFIYAKDANGKPYSPAWYTLNLKAAYQLSDIFSFSGGLENITDQRYRPYSSGIVAGGRNMMLSLQARF